MPKYPTAFSHASNYFNRELSWLLFNQRVLGEAKDNLNPLFERLKFLGITASNLDEFFMVRIAALKDMVDAEIKRADISGKMPSEQLKDINKAVHQLVKEQYDTYNRSLLPKLKQNGLRIIKRHEELNEKEAAYVDRYFAENIYPLLNPVKVLSSGLFPLFRNKSCNIGVLLRKKIDKSKKNIEFAAVQVPSGLKRIILVYADKITSVILLEEVIERNIQKLFLGDEIITTAHFRIMRSADLNIEEDETEDLLVEVEERLKMRQRGEAIRLEAEAGIDKRLLKIINGGLSMKREDIFLVDGPLDLAFLMKMDSLSGFGHLKESIYPKPAPLPGFCAGMDIFAKIRAGDILLHHPFEDFTPVAEFVRQAAVDDNVLAIKQTLYRVSGNSPIIASLALAAENGKQVTVLVELKARFDEGKNIVWAKKLEQSGCNVIYGLAYLKTHCKITLVVRREAENIRRYVHLGTGNYNDQTARLYTDLSLFTLNEKVGADAAAVFEMLSGGLEPLNLNKLFLAPWGLKERLLYLIGREGENAKAGRAGHIIMKVNSLCDKDIIEALYLAASFGAKIDLIVRGICCLKTGLKELKKRIRIRSIIGNFLEHSRIFYFANDGNPLYYASSADLMPRNLERRVEIMFPIEQPDLVAKMKHIIETLLADTAKAHFMADDGSYRKIGKRGKELFNSQLEFGLKAVGTPGPPSS
ncbi:MAG: polyphosphate kinase 1 [Lachnospiraceae bacterium]|nr:polyphosphate kinase 1 [Lachnospiraceae bacterium]